MKNSRGNHNAVWLVAGEFISRIIAFGSVVWLINYLGSYQYGILATALATANLLVIVADFGLSTYVVKELSRDLTKTNVFIGELLGIKIILSVITVGLLALIGVLVPSIDARIIITAGSSIILSNARMFIEAYFRAHQRMHLETYTKIGGSVLLASMTVYFILQKATLYTMSMTYLVSATLSLALAMVILHYKIANLRIHVSKQRFIQTIKLAWPFALSIAFNYLFNYMDTAMLGWFGFHQAAGWYGAAYKPIFFFTSIAGMIISAYFPIISDQFKKDSTKVPIIVRKLFKINMLTALPLALGGTVLAPFIFNVLFTSDYQPGILAFQILLWSTVLIFFWATFGNTLQACDQEKVYVRGFAWAAGINTILNLLLIPSYTLYGAAIATLATQAFLAIFMYRKYKQLLS